MSLFSGFSGGGTKTLPTCKGVHVPQGLAVGPNLIYTIRYCHVIFLVESVSTLAR